jgi:hypothetical protein
MITHLIIHCRTRGRAVLRYNFPFREEIRAFTSSLIRSQPRSWPLTSQINFYTFAFGIVTHKKTCKKLSDDEENHHEKLLGGPFFHSNDNLTFSNIIDFFIRISRFFMKSHAHEKLLFIQHSYILPNQIIFQPLPIFYFSKEVYNFAYYFKVFLYNF